MRKLEVMKVREILRLNDLGLKIREIASSCGCGKSTVSEVVSRAKGAGITDPSSLTDKQLMSAIYPIKAVIRDVTMPDMEYVFKEMKKPSVTLMLLWEEYKTGNPDGIMYSQFCERYRSFKKRNKIELHKEHKAGQEMEADWAGKTISYKDPIIKKDKEAVIFVSVLPASHYPFAKAYENGKMDNWIDAHVSAFEYYGGVAKIIIPDNTKTAVTKADLFDPILNKTYYEMARHYGTTIIPARPEKPKDKASDENAVGLVSRRIIAALRDQQFFSIGQINEAIEEKLEELINRPFQKMDGNRKTAFNEIDKPALMPLPKNRYEVSHFKEMKIPFNYHVEFDGFYYSVPYENIEKWCSIRATARAIEVFVGTERIACHKRNYNEKRRYTTDPGNMPDNHRIVSGWDDDRFISWAAKIGEQTRDFIKYVLSTSQYSVQTYRTCMGIMRLANSYEPEVVEASSKSAIEKNVYASKYFEMILKKKKSEFEKSNIVKSPVSHGNIRGADAFRGGGFNA